MSTNGATVPAGGPLELPPFSLEVQTLDLGPAVKAVGLELIGTEDREPVTGPDGAEMWAAIVPALGASEPCVLDFFSHIDRVAEFCAAHDIPAREGAGRCLVVPLPPADQLKDLFARFAAETFGLRAGSHTQVPDAELEGDLSKRGLDAYQTAYARYHFCAICEPNDGWLTLLSDTLWSSEVIRRVRPALQPFDVYISRPQ